MVELADQSAAEAEADELFGYVERAIFVAELAVADAAAARDAARAARVMQRLRPGAST